MGNPYYKQIFNACRLSLKKTVPQFAFTNSILSVKANVTLLLKIFKHTLTLNILLYNKACEYKNCRCFPVVTMSTFHDESMLKPVPHFAFTLQIQQ